MSLIDPVIARLMINTLGGYGTPPEFGIEYYTVGLEPYLKVFETDYFNFPGRQNISTFKLVVGNYGGGKTHFLYSIRNIAWRYNYITSYVSLSATECPFDKLELVYRKIVSNITPPLNEKEMMNPYERGIEALLRKWYYQVRDDRNFISLIKGLESISFANCIKGALSNLAAEDEDGFLALVQWLKGEDIPRALRLQYRIAERIDRTSAFRMLRSLIQFINTIGYNGLVLLFDEAERGMSFSSARDKRRALDNLRQIIDECGNSRLPGAIFFYAVPDENLLLEGTGGVYEALKQRLRSNFTRINPVGVKIDLEKIEIEPMEFLLKLGEKLALIFESAYECKFEDGILQKSIKNMANAVLEMQMLDISYRRLFVVGMIDAFGQIKNLKTVIDREAARQILKTRTVELLKEEKEKVEREEF
ncbi:MAG: ATP-binding protein [candidate division WOR-3 bacterium]|nr:ATP-binding protein [candidate division WOR-3 bacterium]